MADIELVIKINEDDVHRIVSGFTNEDDAVLFANLLNNGTPLPKGHGRLIDVNSVCQIVRPIEPSDSEWGMTAETAKQIIHNAFKKAPTIIEADKGESEEEE